jgi:2-iminobutanoate/2-iminopropanoate deaminase
MFANFALSLELLGARMSDAIALKTYLTDWRDLPAYRTAFDRWFGRQALAHAIVHTPGFPLPQATVEAELVAAIGSRDRHFAVAAPVNADGTVVHIGDPRAQATAALADLRVRLAAAGFDPGEVVLLNVALADVRDLPAFDEACAAVFAPPYPARTVTGAASPAADALVQIEAIAVRGGGHPIGATEAIAALGHASPAILAGEHLYIGGQLGIEPTGTLSSTVTQQTRAAWQRVRALLAAADLGIEDVVHTTNVLTDWRAYAGFNAGYGAHAHAPYPPRATVIGGLALPRALVQIEAIAHRRGRDATFIDVTG